MQRVRLSTAHAHILLTDKGTCEHGLALLDQTAQLALSSGYLVKLMCSTRRHRPQQDSAAISRPKAAVDSGVSLVPLRRDWWP
jgi:hypothetical protein